MPQFGASLTIVVDDTAKAMKHLYYRLNLQLSLKIVIIFYSTGHLSMVTSGDMQ
jgi:hypothetical protein